MKKGIHPENYRPVVFKEIQWNLKAKLTQW